MFVSLFALAGEPVLRAKVEITTDVTRLTFDIVVLL